MGDRDFLIWLHQRFVKVHGESPLADYMHSLRMIIASTDKNVRHIGVSSMISMDVLNEINKLDEIDKWRNDD